MYNIDEKKIDWSNKIKQKLFSQSRELDGSKNLIPSLNGDFIFYSKEDGLFVKLQILFRKSVV